jgi:DUF1365 family protein
MNTPLRDTSNTTHSAAPAPGASAAQIGFGDVRHTRLRPARNAFRYPAYFLRLPVRHLNAALSRQRWLSHNRWNLFSFYDHDHGDPQTAANPLEWIEILLRGAGIADADGDIWLHAFPRVLGYVFNPVSFWFCHRADGALRAIVCEVCNTFGERHCYLLDSAAGAPLKFGQELSTRKVFHVSPFCKIEGSYRFRFMQARGHSVARIDYDDANGPLLLTSISGALETLNDRALLRAFFRVPLFTFGVIARIHWQAAKLWVMRIPFIPKPKPPVVQVTR